jgi:hypothetical protein
MLRAGGAEVTVAGFWRGDSAPAEVAGARPVPLGRTFDADLRHRAKLVGQTLLHDGGLAKIADGSDVLMARNLEMLLLGARAKSKSQPLVYECLDIHRAMLGWGLASAGLRAVERRLLRSTSLLIYSSPAFIRGYFEPTQQLSTPSLLVENKLLSFSGRAANAQPCRPGAPWTIGWFGNLRCRKSLGALSWLAGHLDGKARILVAGRASPAELPDFLDAVAKPNIDFAGAYSARDLPDLYARCHFAWCIDYFEEGLNSEWLLPNRIYEAIACGAVPIASQGTETARWLEAHGAGVCLPREGLIEALRDLLGRLDDEKFRRLETEVRSVPQDAVVAGQADCDRLVAAIAQ